MKSGSGVHERLLSHRAVLTCDSVTSLKVELEMNHPSLELGQPLPSRLKHHAKSNVAMLIGISIIGSLSRTRDEPSQVYLSPSRSQ